MDHPHAPVGLLTRLLRWLGDFAAMPGRIRELADGAKAANDPRISCLRCGEGRIADYRNIGLGAPVCTIGICNSCGTEWEINVPNQKIIRLWSL